MPEKRAIAVATPLGPKRIEAHKRNGTINRPNDRFKTLDGRGSRKTDVDAAPSRERSSNVSSHCFVVVCSTGFSTHVRTSGATTSAPTPSPIHQVNHNDLKLLQEAAPPRQRLTLPSVPPKIGLNIAASSTNFKTSLMRKNGLCNPTKRRIRTAADKASSAFPTAIPVAVPIGSPVARLARNAPTRIAGEIR